MGSVDVELPMGLLMLGLMFLDTSSTRVAGFRRIDGVRAVGADNTFDGDKNCVGLSAGVHITERAVNLAARGSCWPLLFAPCLHSDTLREYTYRRLLAPNSRPLEKKSFKGDS